MYMWQLHLERGKLTVTMYSVIYDFHPVPMLGDQFLTMAYAKTLFSKEQNFRFIDLHVSVCLCIIVMYMQVPGKSRRGCGSRELE